MKGESQAYQQQVDHFISLKDLDAALNCMHDGLEQSGYDLGKGKRVFLNSATGYN